MNNKEIVAKALHDVLNEELTMDQIEQLLENPKSVDHGDVAFPAFSLAKIYRKAPQQIAAELAEKIDGTNFEKIEVVGPYLNFFMNKEAVSQAVIGEVVKEKNNYGNSTFGNNGNVPIDMSSPNIAKPISMGHLRSTVIGNSIAFILEKIGYQPIRINHLGDWGTQFGKLIVAYKKWGSEEAVRQQPINELLRLYVQFHEEAEENPELEDEARAWFKKLEEGDQEANELWKWFRSESLKEFDKIYSMLEVEFDSYNGEAFYNDKMDEIVTLLEEKHLLTENQGAEIVDLTEYNLNPALIRKSDGATLYITRDLAAALYRKRTYDFAKSLYVVGNEQSNHFKQLKAVLKEQGETGPYVQYTHARAMSILRKANFTPDATQRYALNDKDSWEVVKLLQKFPETVMQAAEKYEPSVIAKHSIHLAQAFNKYYAHVRILDEDAQKEARLALVYAVATVLKEDLRLLGLHAPEEM